MFLFRMRYLSKIRAIYFGHLIHKWEQIKFLKTKYKFNKITAEEESP